MARVLSRAAGTLALTAGLLGAWLPLAPAAGQPTRGQVSIGTPFDALLLQKNRDKPLFVVTSDGETFTDARLVRDTDSPLLIRYELECDDGFTDPLSGDVYSDGRLNDVVVETDGWKAELPRADADWGYGLDFLFDVMNNESVKGDFNIVDKGPDAGSVRSHLNSLKPKVIAACNDAVAAKVRQGFSRKTALTQIGLIDPIPSIGPEMLPAVLRATCEHDIFRPKEDEDHAASHRTKTELAVTPPLQLRLPVLCKSPFAAPRPATDSLTQGFGVQEIELAPERDPYKGPCPLTVRLSGHAKLSGSGPFRYRYRTGSGALGAPVTVQVKDGRTPVALSLSIEVGRSPSGPGFTTPDPDSGDGLTLTVPLPDPDPAGPTLSAARTPKRPGQAATGLAAPGAPGQITDWVRLEVLSPSGGLRASEEVFYKAICEQSVVAGGGRVTAPPREPDRPLPGSRRTPAPRDEPRRADTGSQRVSPGTSRADQGQRLQFEIQVLTADLNQAAGPRRTRGLRTGPATLTIDRSGGRLRGTVTQGRTVVGGLLLSMDGCRRGALDKWTDGAQARLVRRGRGSVEIRVRHPEVDGCVLVGSLD
jgi:hypothetical protein